MGRELANSRAPSAFSSCRSDRHNHDDLPILLAGKGGGMIKSGRHVVYPNQTPLTNLFLSLLDRMRVHAETLGDSTGKLAQLM